MKNVSTFKRPTTLSAALFIFVICLFGISASNAEAATITVDSNLDTIAVDGQCTLREAITSANTNASFNDCSAGVGDDVIDFSVTGEIVLNSVLPSLSSNINIDGPGAAQLTVRRNSGAASFRIFTVPAGPTVTISGLTIKGGRAVSAFGGGIFNEGNLTVNSCTISNNSTTFGGGGVFTNGQMTVNNSIISGNSANSFGGGIVGVGLLTINGTTVSGNNSGYGGGVNCDGGTITINSSTVSGNSATDGGGGIYNNGTIIMNNSTLSGNVASADGGGIDINANHTFIVRNSTISGNRATRFGGGIFKSIGVNLSVDSCIVANNIGMSGPDVLGALTSGDFNLIENPAGVFLTGTNNITGVDPKLGPLQYNGGPTKTHSLLPGSPAINQGDNSQALLTDQRGAGFDRVTGPAADMGAFEIQPVCAGTSFAPSNIAAGNAPVDVATGDFNGDGLLDMATADRLSSTVSVLMRTADNTGFAAPVVLAVDAFTSGVAAGDFNNDGRIDVAASVISEKISVFLRKADNTGFEARLDSAAGDIPVSIAVGNFNGDAYPDVATTGIQFNSVLVTLGNGDGTFGTPTAIGVGNDPQSVAVGDLDGDGDADLAATGDSPSNFVSVLLGNGAGAFVRVQDYAVGARPQSVAIADLDGDGDLDLATANLNDDNVSVLAGTGNGSFGAAVNYPVGDGPVSVAVGDLDGDGLPDLIAADFSPFAGTDNIAVLTRTANNASYEPAQFFLVGIDPQKVTVGDFDSNGRLDLAVANMATDNVSVLMNACVPNSAPAAVGDSYVTDEDTPLAGSSVLGNDTDVDNDILTAELVSGPVNAQAFSLNPDGTFSYTPNANSNGTDFFTYKANDGYLDSEVVMVTITVAPINDAPTISANSITRQQAAGLSNSSIASVGDIDNAIGELGVAVNGGASATVNGVTVSNISIDGSGNVTADASAACGASSAMFSLKVTDSGGLFANATLNVTVTNETTAPVIDPILDVTVYLPANSPASSMLVNFPLPTATDNCSTAVVTTSPVSGSVFNVGTTTVNVTAKDALNNTSTATFTVKVLYNFGGFYQPVDPMPMLNIAEAGSSIPVKFSLSGNKGLGILAAGYPMSTPIPCDQNEPGSQVEETVSAGNSVLTYDAQADQYKYVWTTNKLWKGTCRMLVVKLTDGSEHYAKFRFK